MNEILSDFIEEFEIYNTEHNEQEINKYQFEVKMLLLCERTDKKAAAKVLISLSNFLYSITRLIKLGHIQSAVSTIYFVKLLQKAESYNE